jgi:hypothetical protein
LESDKKKKKAPDLYFIAEDPQLQDCPEGPKRATVQQGIRIYGHQNMPAMIYDRASEYGSVPLAYRSKSSCSKMPDLTHDSPAARAMIPQKPGYGTKNSGPPEKCPVMMLNGRKLLQNGEEPSFDQHSFMFARQPLQFRGDWEDIPDVRDNYLPEVEALVRQQVPGADHPDAKVLIFDHAIRTHNRNVKKKNEENPSHGWGGYANTVHTDATVRSIHTRCKDQVMGTNETVVKYQGQYPACWGDVRPTREWQVSCASQV